MGMGDDAGADIINGDFDDVVVDKGEKNEEPFVATVEGVSEVSTDKSLTF